MKTIFAAAAAALALAGCEQQGRSGDSSPASAHLPPEQESQAYIIESEGEWAALAVRRGPAALERILAEDYSGVSGEGTVRTKAQEIAYWNALPLAASAEPPKTALRLFGGTAIFQGDQLLLPAAGAAPVRILWTDVWMFRDGRWQVVASQNATVAPKG